MRIWIHLKSELSEISQIAQTAREQSTLNNLQRRLIYCPSAGNNEVHTEI